MTRTRLVVIRLEDEEMIELQEQAKQEGIHINALITRILKSYLTERK